jgi:hypothetical protein
MTGLSIALMGLLTISVILNVVQRRAMALMLRHFREMLAATNEALDLLAEARMYVGKEREAAKGEVRQ